MKFIKNYVARLKSEFSGYNVQKLTKDLLAGLTVAAVALPLALAFGVSSGADAAAGLLTAIIAGIVISALSGASYQISGPTGAMTAVLVMVVSQYKMQGVFIVSLIAGIILLLAGIFRLGKLIRFIPMPVVTGFTSGIAIIIALGQIDNFFGTTSQGETAIEKLLSYGELGFHVDWKTLLIGALVVAIMLVWPKKWNAVVPSSLVGIIVAAVVCTLAGFEVATVGEIPRTLFPEVRLTFSQINWSAFPNYISPAITVAALAMIESLLCGASASVMKGESFDADQELIAQGVGNIMIPFFGGVPATAAIARTSVAIKSGGVTRLTGIFHALWLLASMFLLSSVMSILPLSALAGVLMVTAWRMNEWHTIRYIFKNKFPAAIVQYLVTMIATVLFDLTVAIVIGVIVAAFCFLIKESELKVVVSDVKNSRMTHSNKDVESLFPKTKIVYVVGSLFFANIEQLTAKLHELQDAPQIILSLKTVNMIDVSAAKNLLETVAVLKEKGTSITFSGVQENVQMMLKRADGEKILDTLEFASSIDAILLR